jgi:hypothetical protein
MATLKQIEANRLNAQKSTGPRTDAGKVASAQNARKHGCYSTYLVLEGQDQEQYDQLLDEFMRDLQPRDIRERNLVEMMAVEWWHLGQCEFMRSHIYPDQYRRTRRYTKQWQEISSEHRLQLVAEHFSTGCLKDMLHLSQLKDRVNRNYHKASREFDKLRDDRLRRQAEPLPEAEPCLTAPAPDVLPIPLENIPTESIPAPETVELPAHQPAGRIIPLPPQSVPTGIPRTSQALCPSVHAGEPETPPIGTSGSPKAGNRHAATSCHTTPLKEPFLHVQSEIPKSVKHPSSPRSVMSAHFS